MCESGGVVFFTFYQSDKNFRSYNAIWIGSWHTYQENKTLHEPDGNNLPELALKTRVQRNPWNGCTQTF